jgi:16S rRNA (guanine966-N2)-methyltransferase
MRVIGGRYRGRKLKVVRGEIRPTIDRLREALFAHLGAEVKGSVWLDLFAGSGAVGIEALSRDADFVLFNDRSRDASRLLRANLRRVGVESGYQILQKDAFVLLRRAPELFNQREFSHIFLDPPYDFGRHEKLIRKLMASPLTQARPAIILEVFKKTPVDFIPPELQVIRRLRGGDSHLLLLTFQEISSATHSKQEPRTP